MTGPGRPPYGGEGEPPDPERRDRVDRTAEEDVYNPYGDSQPTRQMEGWNPQEPPRPTSKTKKKKNKKVPLPVIALVLVAVLALGAGGLYLGGVAADELRAEPVAYADPEPFTATVGAGTPLPPPTVDTPTVPLATVTGDSVGLYGGTGDDKTCDREQLIAFLEQDPQKAAAWAAVQGIQPAQIRAFVAGLTAVVLRSDTAVTNHGFRNGQATPISSVLQGGTAVLVDDRGVPRARCKCGNPLIEPVRSSRTTITGQPWAGFDQNRVAVVRPSPKPITEFRLINIFTNENYAQRVDNSINVGGSVTAALPDTSTGGPATASSTRPGQTSQQQAPQTSQQRAPQQPQQPQQAPASTTQRSQESQGEVCEYTDAGDGSPIRAREGSTFTDSRGESYRVPKGCGPLG